MTKHVLIHNPKYNCAASIDVERFAECVRKLEDDARPLVRWPLSWFDTLLLAHTSDGRIEVTPRGQDLLASIDSLPDDPKSEVKTTPCSKCNGSGEQPLFVSMETCDRCKGSKVEPRASGIDFNTLVNAFDGKQRPTYEIQVTSGRTSSKRPNTDTLPRIGYSAFIYPTASGEVTERVSEHPWVLIDSKEVAQQFVGKRVQIDATAKACYRQHSMHGAVLLCTAEHEDHLYFGGAGCVYWRARGNVRLRLVDGDPS